MTEREFYTLAPGDVGRFMILAFGRAWMTSGFIGCVLAGDVGKRVYLVDGILQVENDEQRERREQAEAAR